jgi:hypothetical protein
MQHGDLDKTKVLKTQRDYKSDERKPNFKSAEIYPTGHTGFTYRLDRLDLFQNKSGPPDMSGPLPGLQRGFLDMSGPQPRHVWWCNTLATTGLAVFTPDSPLGL